MNDTLASLLLGIIEGITEFLPISSTGHLLIAEHWLGARSDLFNIAIQAGAILAVVLIYRARLLELVLGLGQARNRTYSMKLALAFGVTAVLGLLVKKLGVELPETLAPIAWALLVGGVVMLGAEALAARCGGDADGAGGDRDNVSWTVAALVGVAQVVAGVFPGTSRSAAAIFAALLFGRGSRVAATEFAFLVGIPTMFAATGYELLHVLKDGGAAGEDWSGLGIAFVASAVTAFVAVKWLLGYIQTHRFTVFAWYRIVLGAALLAWAFAGQDAAASVIATPQSAPTAAEAHASDVGNGPGAPVADSAAPTPTASASRSVARQRASAGFVHAATCFEAARIAARGLRNPIELAEAKASLVDAAENAMTEMTRDRVRVMEAEARLLAHASTECSPTEKLTAQDVSAAALRAGDLGDFAAAECYVIKPAVLIPAPDVLPPIVQTPAELAARAAYVANARRLIAAGLDAGDWRMAQLAMTYADPRAGYVGINDPSDPTVLYRMASLLRHGMATARRQDDMAGVAAFAAKSLDASQLARADAWVAARLPVFSRTPPMVGSFMCPMPGLAD
jgi:undecaprenyl-diphosphatase